MLPDPANPNFVTFFAVVGAFVGVTIARWRGEENVAARIEESTYYAVAIGLTAYLVSVSP
jgi:hypothetical protein